MTDLPLNPANLPLNLNPAEPPTPDIDIELDRAWERYAERLGDAALPRAQFDPGALPPGYALVYAVVAEVIPQIRLDAENRKWIHPGDPVENGPRTPEVLTQMRREAAAYMEREHPSGSSITFTCDRCGFAPLCPLVYDSYNTGGDCLWEK